MPGSNHRFVTQTYLNMGLLKEEVILVNLFARKRGESITKIKSFV